MKFKNEADWCEYVLSIPDDRIEAALGSILRLKRGPLMPLAYQFLAAL
jgi:hypothetical protein